MQKLLFAGFLFLSGVSLVSLAQNTDQLKAVLDKAAADAETLKRDLPSVTCKEAAISQEIKNGEVKKEVRFAADLRAIRLKDGTLNEHLDFTELNGKPFLGRSFKLPIIAQGGLDEPLLYFLPESQSCFNFKLSSARIDIDSVPGAETSPRCGRFGGASGFALLDEDRHIRHIEHRVPQKFSMKIHVTEFTSIDLVPAILGGRSYMLSTGGTVENYPHGRTLRFQTAYSDCKLFKATVTLHDDVRPVHDETTEPHP